MTSQLPPNATEALALVEEPKETGFAPLRFDPAEYMHYVEDMDLTEAQAIELLRVIWAINVAWVDLGFGINPIQQAMDKSGEVFPSGFPDVIGSLNKVSENDKNGHTEHANGHEAVKEES